MAQELLPEGKEAADYNQAVMDFGAMQCVPKSPKCEDCPLVDGCAAFRDRRIQEFPVKSRALTVTERYLHYMYIEVGERLQCSGGKATIYGKVCMNRS